MKMQTKFKTAEAEIRKLTKIAMSGPDGVKYVTNEIGQITVRRPCGEKEVMQGIANAVATKYGFQMVVLSPMIHGQKLRLVPSAF